jgi:hypothetical protein
MQESANSAQARKTCRNNRGRTGTEQEIAAPDIAITTASEKMTYASFSLARPSATIRRKRSRALLLGGDRTWSAVASRRPQERTSPEESNGLWDYSNATVLRPANPTKLQG